jgi:hypothetical protein
LTLEIVRAKRSVGRSTREQLPCITLLRNVPSLLVLDPFHLFTTDTTVVGVASCSDSEENDLRAGLDELGCKFWWYHGSLPRKQAMTKTHRHPLEYVRNAVETHRSPDTCTHSSYQSPFTWATATPEARGPADAAQAPAPDDGCLPPAPGGLQCDIL